MDRRYVGIDLHGRRSVIYAMDAQGERDSTVGALVARDRDGTYHLVDIARL